MQSAKQALRKNLLTERRKVSPMERHAVDEGVFLHITASDLYQKAQTVFLYCSTAEEIDTSHLMENALQAGKRVCVPLCTGPGIMEARELKDLAQLSPGRFGILEPPADSAPISPEEIDLCIVPCLAADTAGNRLGYGGGYYDRFLARTPAPAAALCAGHWFLRTLPTEPHDQRCDIIVTERQVHIAKPE